MSCNDGIFPRRSGTARRASVIFDGLALSGSLFGGYAFRRYFFAGLVLAFLLSAEMGAKPQYAWPHPSTSTVAQIPPPAQAQRVSVNVGSFAEWLRSLPLKPSGSPVLLYNGRLKGNQGAHYRVVDMDVGSRDLQQCADALIRLRSEYLFSVGKSSNIVFSFTSGDRIPFRRWQGGERPVVQGNRVVWRGGASKGQSHQDLMSYLNMIYMYAGSISLQRDTVPVSGAVQPGQLFVQGGSPGHAVLVLDVAVDRAGRRFYLLGQSYMPAQEFHVLKNPLDDRLSPWYVDADAGVGSDPSATLETPEWTFKRSDRRAFKET